MLLKVSVNTKEKREEIQRNLILIRMWLLSSIFNNMSVYIMAITCIGIAKLEKTTDLPEVTENCIEWYRVHLTTSSN
jgi:hypothetical protein